jgi:type II secretory pathway pseudopilin PulG
MKRSGVKGFNLVEILVSFTILLFVLLGIASIFPAGHAFIKASGNITRASFVAQSVLEEYRRKDFTQIVSGTGSITLNETFSDRTNSIPYNYTVTVSAVNSDLKSIIVLVSWPGNVGRRNLTVSSLIYNKLMQ